MVEQVMACAILCTLIREHGTSPENLVFTPCPLGPDREDLVSEAPHHRGDSVRRSDALDDGETFAIRGVEITEVSTSGYCLPHHSERVVNIRSFAISILSHVSG